MAVSEIIEAVLWRAFNHQASVRAPPAPDEVCSDDSDQRARPRDRAVRWFAVLESTRREVLLGRAWDAPRPATRTGADSTVGERSDRGPTRDESSVSAVCVCWLTPTLIQVSRLRPGSDCAGRVETGSTSGCKGPLGSSVQGAAWFVSARGRLVRQSCHQARHKRAGETVPGRRSRSNAGDDGCTECGACSTGGHTDGENFGADRDHPVQCVKE